MVETLKILALGVVAAIAYGIAHDNVTARVCVEYFTVGHPKIIASESPTLLALAWGVVATWWVGLGLGVLLAAVCRVGDENPKLRAVYLLKPLAKLLAVIAVVSEFAGLLGYFRYKTRLDWVGPLARHVPIAKHPAFMADAYADAAAYLAAFIGGLILARWASLARVRAGKLAEPVPLTPLA